MPGLSGSWKRRHVTGHQDDWVYDPDGDWDSHSASEELTFVDEATFWATS